MRVLGYDEAAERADITRRSFERLVAAGEGPAIIHVSPRRVGVLDVDLDNWLMSRRRRAPGEPSEMSRRHAAPGEAPEKK
jgi:hypothetical protein